MKKVLSLLIVFFVLAVNQFAQNNSVTNVNTSFPFYDDAESISTSNSYWQRDTLIWKIQSVTAHSGTNAWEMLPTTGSYNYLTLATSIDLSATPNPYLSLWVRKLDGGGGYLTLEVSTNGGTNWTALYQPYFSGAQYNRIQTSLANYKLANVLIRIGGYVPSGGTYLIDDILIDNAPSPQPIVLTSPTDNGMNVHWNQSTAADFYRYRIIVSTNTNDVNNYYVTPSLSHRSETKVFDIFTKAALDTTLTDLTFTNTLYYAKVYEEDTQNLVNQGSDRSDLSTSFNITAQTAPFIQDFEGTLNWVADLPWAITTDDAADPNHSTTHAYEDSPQGSYDVNTDRRLTFQVNLSGVAKPMLKFNQKYSFEAGYDFGSVDISSDNINWVTLDAFTGNNGGEWESRQFDISVLKKQSTGYVRFRTQSNGANNQDGWHIDDVEVLNDAKVQTFPFFDDVEVDTFSTNHWIQGGYDLKLANAHSGAQVWSLKPSGGSYSYLTLAGKMNLSSAPNPYISLWVKKADGGGGYLSIEASNDGGQNWTVLSQPYFNGTQYTWFQSSLANFRQANIVVRVGCYTPSGGTYYIDDILIDNAPTPKGLTLLSPTNNGLRAKWGVSTASDFGSYRLIISTDANQVNDYFNTNSLSFRIETRVYDFYNKAMVDTTFNDLTFANTMYYAKLYERDTQLLVNQGTDRSDLSTAFTVISQTAPFIQDFEGSFGWAADIPWAVTTDDAADPGHSGTHAFEDSPGSNYSPNTDRRLVFQTNTLTVSRPVLRFNHRYAFEPGYDFGVIEYSVDNLNWKMLTGFTGNTNTLWETREFDIAPIKQLNAAYVRFRTQSNSATHLDGWHIDDVEIYNNAKQLGIPLNDDAEADSVSSKYWIKGLFNIIAANAYGGSQVWALPPAGGTYNYLTLSGLLNLTNAPKPYISFWVKKANSGGGYVAVEASIDGGLNWVKLKEPYFSGNTYTQVVTSLANYRQNNVLVRIGGYSPSGDTYYLDDITIADSTGWTGIEDISNITPDNFELSQNYPNPFNPSTTIRYALPSESKVLISVYNLLGQEVATLLNDVQSSGYHEVVFNAKGLSSGVYLYNIRAVTTSGSKEFSNTKKLILLK